MRDTTVLRVLITVGALILAALHQLVPSFRLDAPTVILFVVSILPWVQPLLKSVELLGVKLELQELKDQVADAKGASESAKQQAFFAQSVAAPAASDAAAQGNHIAGNTDSLESLADKYEYIRATQESGDSRTRAMTDIVHKMVELAPHRGNFDLAEALSSHRPGIRLAAYATLYATPDVTLLDSLIKSIANVEDKPFGQYWGLQAIGRAVDLARREGAIPPNVVEDLVKLVPRFRRGTDRDYELRRILERVRNGR